MPFVKSAPLPIVGTRVAMFDVAAAVAIVLWAAARTQQRSWATTARAPSLDMALLGFVVVAAASGSTVWRTFGSRAAVAQFALELGVLLYLVSFFVAARDLLTRLHAVSTAIAAWMAGATVSAALGLIGAVEMFRCVRPLSSLVLWDTRLTSTFINPNQLAAYLVVTIPLAAAVWLAAGERAALALSAGAATLASIVALVLSASRGGLVGMVAGAVTMTVLAWRSTAYRRMLAAMIAATIVVLAVAHLEARRGNVCLAYAADTTTSLTVHLAREIGLARYVLNTAPRNQVVFGADTASAFAFRAQMSRYAFALAAAHPIVGAGLGTMHLYVYELTHHQAYVDAHNMFLTVMAETGVSGLLLFGWFVGWMTWRAFSLSRAAEDPFVRTVAVGLTAGLVGFLLMSTSLDAQRQRVLWTAFAVVFAMWRTSMARSGHRDADLR